MSVKAHTAPNRRYVIREEVGRGGMGVVYRAYDNETRRDVTLKSLLDITDPGMLELFRKECEIVSHLNHPNIVDIYDVGQLEDGKPYFVMPLLPGVTLDKLIADAAHPLSVERVVDITAQACRGLHAAHERGLIHRDVKPSNIFVLADDSVKIIDFGVAHLASNRSQTTVKGTLYYMAPEQLQMKKPTPASDLFSLAVVCYEALTRKRAFDGASADEIIQSVLHSIPAPASELNPAVNRVLGQVVHKAMSKQAFHRFSNIREFADYLQKAVRGEAVALFDESKMASRLERAMRSLEAGELDFASEVVGGLESEGYTHPDMAPLRRQIDQARKEKAVRQLLEQARRCVREEEPQLALHKIHEILQIDPRNSEAIDLGAEIESKRNAEQIQKWLHLARQHLDNHAYSHARQALQDVLGIKPDETQARKMLAEIKVREQEYLRAREEKERLYQEAIESWRKGEVTAALSDLERVLELDRRAPDASNATRASDYQKFYNQVRSGHDALKAAYEEARRQLNQRNFPAALSLCEEWLAKYPGHPLFQALKVDVEEGQRQDLSAFIAQIDREVEAEPDLDRRVSLLEEALKARPGETHFERARQLAISKRDLVNSIVAKARGYEERRQFSEALNHWGMLRTIYSSFPGLDFEEDRVSKRREQQARSDAKSRWVEQVDRSLSLGEWQKALDLTAAAFTEFPEDAEMKAMAQLAEQGMARSAEAQGLMEQGVALCASSRFEEGIATLRRAMERDERNPQIRGALLEALLTHARAAIETDPDRADQLAIEALEIDPSSPLAKSVRTLILDRKRDQYVDQCLAQARRDQADGAIDRALSHVEEALGKYPQEARLLQSRVSLERERNVAERRRSEERQTDLNELLGIKTKAEESEDAPGLRTLLDSSIHIAGRHTGDRDFDSIVQFLRDRLSKAEQRTVVEPSVEAPVSAAPPVGAPAIAEEPQQVEPAPRRAPAPERRRTPATLLVRKAILLLAGLVALIGVAYLIYRPTDTDRRQFFATVALTSEPAGATVLIDDKPIGTTPQSIQLAQGNHVIAYTLEGYEPIKQDCNVAPGVTCDGIVRMIPLKASIHVTTDISDARLLIDGVERQTAPPGVPLDIADLALSQDHKLEISSRTLGAELLFKALAGVAPEFALTPGSKIPLVLVVGSSGSRARLVSSKPVKVSMDGGKSFQEVGPEGLPLSNFPSNPTISVDDGSGETHNLGVVADASPSINAYFFTGKPATNLGGLQIEVTGGTGFTILVDGTKPPYVQKGPPLWRVNNIPVGQHEVRIQQEGFIAEPVSKKVEVKPNTGTPLAFKLTPSSTSLIVRGALPGTQATLDGRPVVLPEGGEFKSEVAAGAHELVLQKNGYRPRKLTRQVAAGVNWTIGPEQARLEPLQGTIAFRFIDPPRGVSVKIEQQSGEVKFDAVELTDPRSVVVPKGYYVVIFTPRDKDYESDQVNPEIVDGEVKTIPVHLRKK